LRRYVEVVRRHYSYIGLLIYKFTDPWGFPYKKDRGAWIYTPQGHFMYNSMVSTNCNLLSGHLTGCGGADPQST